MIRKYSYKLIILSFFIIFFLSIVNIKPNANASKISVKDYGAIGDGITDDTTAIKKAIWDCVGKTLYFPSGTYIISGQINIPSNSTIIGDGKSSLIIATPGMKVGTTMLSTTDASNVSLSNISISGNIAYNTRSNGHSDKDGIHLFDVWNSANINISNCHFLDNVYAAIRVIHGASDFTIDNCLFSNVDCGFIVLSTGDIDDLTIKDSTFDGHDNSEPISLFGAGIYSNITIQHNIIKNKPLGCSIFCGNGGNCTINNLYILENELYDNANGIHISNAQNVEIANNTINFSGLLKDSGSGIKILSCDIVNIHDNLITKTGQQGLRISNSSSVIVDHNTFSDCGYTTKDYHALDLRDRCTYLTIKNNVFSRSDSSLSDCFLSVNCTGSLNITNNTFYGCKATIFSDMSDITISSK